MFTAFVHAVAEKVEAQLAGLTWRSIFKVVDFICQEELAGKSVEQVVEDVIAKFAAGAFA